MKLSVREGKLYVHADGQAEHVLGFDSEGDFFPLDFNARLSPRRSKDGMTFIWSQGGGEAKATREPGRSRVGRAAAPAGVHRRLPR